jgi:predicted GNAT family acetyltransferase
MRIEHFSRPDQWLEVVTPYLVEREAEHNLLFGLARVMTDNPGIYPEYSMAAVFDATDSIVGAAIRTPPHAAILSHLNHPDVLDALIQDFHQRYPDLPSVNSRDDQAKAFAERWTSRYGGIPTMSMPQRIYQINQVHMPENVPGQLRDANLEDRERLATWYRQFLVDVGMDTGRLSDASERWAIVSLTKQVRQVYFWEVDGVPVSMIGVTGPTPHGIRIGPVYTPVELRGHGYASKMTAVVSQQLLDEGLDFCFLYTDLGNPTSNRIYQQIGYTPVCDTSIYLLH